jgi:hypothetical protein
MGNCSTSIWGKGSSYIKLNNSDFVAVEGANILERLQGADIRIPYKQILKGRVILKPGQTNYLLNHLGLGDNATFLAIKSTFDPKSVMEEDNYINYSYFDDMSKIYSFAQLLVLTGNSANRIQQLYLTNPNTKYPVSLDIMVGVIDDEYSFFVDPSDQTAITFTNLEYGDIESHCVGESMVIMDKGNPSLPLVYLNIPNISFIQRDGLYIKIDDDALGQIYLMFKTQFDVDQAYSIINAVLNDNSLDISTLGEDLIDPVLYWNETAGATGSYIEFNSSNAGAPYDTTIGNTFSTTVDLSVNGGEITKDYLIELLIDKIIDNRDGEIAIQDDRLILLDSGATSIASITNTGVYTLSFNFSDIAQNYLDEINIELNII